MNLGDCIEILFIGSVYCKKDKEEGKHTLQDKARVQLSGELRKRS